MSSVSRVVGVWSLFAMAMVAAAAGPAAAGTAHPRLFLDGDTVTALKAAAKVSGSGTARAIKKCDDVIAHPASWTSGGYQGMGFVEPLGACLIAYEVRGDAASAAAAVTYWKALLDDYTTLGDGGGGDQVVRHDSGYAMRMFGPNAAIAYDWLHDAPGVDEGLRSHARERFAAWTSWYDASGYHNHEPGANYHAGYVFAETTIAIAEAGEAGADGDTLWNHVSKDLFGTQLAGAMMPGAVMDGGDWLEGWQYGPLSVVEYAMSARAARDNGVPLAGFAAWEGELATRNVFARTPDGTGEYVGGDTESTTPFNPTTAHELYAVLVDAAPDAAKGWAAAILAHDQLTDDTMPLIAALSEARAPASPTAFPTDASTSTWFYAPGSRTLYARTGWSAQAAWLVSQCAPRRIDDHMLQDAGNVVLTRGADTLIVDPSPYGSLSTLTGNAPTVASTLFPADYVPSQGFWGKDATVDFRWARQTKGGVIAARCDYAGQYQFQDTPPDIKRAMRDLVLVPYGQGDAALILLDDVDGAAADRPLELRLHTTGSYGGSGPWRATVGASDLVVQVASAAGATPTTVAEPQGDCSSAVRGQCEAARFPSGAWKLAVPGTHPQAITIADAVASGTDPGGVTATSGTGWHGAELDRGGKHLAAIAVDPDLTTVTYTAAAGLHVVVGAPAGSGGRADVAATSATGGCAVTVTARASDGGYDARPLVVNVASDCSVTEDPGQPGFGAPGGNDPPPGTSPGSSDLTQGCGCASSPASPRAALAPLALVALASLARRRRGRARR